MVHLGGHLQVIEAVQQVVRCILEAICSLREWHVTSHQRSCIKSQQSAHKVSLDQALGLAGPFFRSYFLIRHHLSVLRKPDYQRELVVYCVA